MSRLTLKQIAQTAGVSIATASRVLRGIPGTSAKSRAAVERALLTLGVAPRAGSALSAYTGTPAFTGAFTLPGAQARAGADTHAAGGAAGAESAMRGSGRAPGQLIAVVQHAPVGGEIDPYEELFLEVSERLFRVGFVPVRVLTGLDQPSVADKILAAGIAGALVLGGGTAGPEAVRLTERGLPVVRVSQTDHRGIPQVMLDSTSGIDTAIRHLVNLGHRRIGLAVPRNSAAAARIASFRKSLAEALHINATRDQAPVVSAEAGLPAGTEAAQQLVDENCTAVICASPSIAYGLLDVAARYRLRIPEHLSMLTVGSLPDADVLNPPASQVTFDWPAVAATSVGALQTMLDRPSYIPNYVVTPELVLRRSEKPISPR